MSRPIDQWLDAYAVSHQNPTNKRLHWICVPAIVVSLIGMLWALPVPALFADASPWLNWGTLFLAAGLVYYLVLSLPLALGMVPVIAGIVAIVSFMDSLPGSLALLSLAVFVIAWIGQFIGHKIEGQKPSFFEDIQFLMIGPLWILAAVFRGAGLKY
ncbi:MAG: Mpo1-like protein [Pseudomonadota bacterium]